MSQYNKLRAALTALSVAEASVQREVDSLASVAKAAVDEAPKRSEAHTVERVAPASAKVVSIGGGVGLTAQVEAAVKAAGVSLSESDRGQLADLEAKLSGLRGKSEREVVEALAGHGVLAIAV